MSRNAWTRTSNRIVDLERFYALLAELESKTGLRELGDIYGSSFLPPKGVYFFFEPRERRTQSRSQLRVVRVGTHAVSNGSRTILVNRLKQHLGTADRKGGNHRGSVFRKLLGLALIQKFPELSVSTWGIGTSASRDVRKGEANLEHEVSRYIGTLPFLWLAIDDAACALSRRAFIERNSIALLSNARNDVQPIDSPSDSWLGSFCPKSEIRQSGLWNSKHIYDEYEPCFLDELEALARSQS